MADKLSKKGDVNGDGDVNFIDAVLIMQKVAGNISLSILDLAEADVNGDLQITATDARMILQHEAGIQIIDDITVL